jgi:hypothetical protein
MFQILLVKRWYTSCLLRFHESLAMLVMLLLRR